VIRIATKSNPLLLQPRPTPQNFIKIHISCSKTSKGKKIYIYFGRRDLRNNVTVVFIHKKTNQTAWKFLFIDYEIVKKWNYTSQLQLVFELWARTRRKDGRTARRMDKTRSAAA